MITKKILNPNRLRRIKGSFGFISHSFLIDGFLVSLGREELLLYFFLVLVGDRYGLFFYAYDSICTLLQFSLEDYSAARNGLSNRDLIAFDSSLFQILELPPKPVIISKLIPHRYDE